MATKLYILPLFLVITLSVLFTILCNFIGITSPDVRLGRTVNVFPRNAAGLQGEPLELNCTFVGRDVQWSYYKLDSGTGNPIYQGGDVLDDYEGIYDKGNPPDNIIIEETNFNSAGKYSCSTIDGGTALKRDIQVASATGVQCSRNSNSPQVEGDTPTLTCTTDVAANSQLMPHFQWYRDGQEVEGWIVQQQVTPTPGAPERIEFNHNLTVSSDDDQVPFECRLHFRYHGDSSDENVDHSDPDYTDSCSTQFEVLFHPKDVYIWPSSHEMGYVSRMVGEMLNCTAKGTEPLRYQWTQINGEMYENGFQLEVTNEMAEFGGPVIFNCTVSNTISGQTETATDQVILYAIHSGATIIHFSAILWITLASTILTVTL